MPIKQFVDLFDCVNIADASDLNMNFLLY